MKKIIFPMLCLFIYFQGNSEEIDVSNHSSNQEVGQEVGQEENDHNYKNIEESQVSSKKEVKESTVDSPDKDLSFAIKPGFFLQDNDENLSKKEKKKKKKICKKERKKSTCPSSDVGLSFAFKPAYFWMQDQIGRDIYKGGFIPLVEICYDFYKGLNIWIESGCFYKKEHVTDANIRVRTNVLQVPLSLGFNYTFAACSFLDLYFKIGPNWLYTKTKVKVPELKNTVVKHSFGATFGIGGKFKVHKGLFLEPFLNYLYNKKKIHDADSNETFERYLGGLQVGLGIGYRF